MSACDFFNNLGIRLDVVGNELRLSPREKVTPEIVQRAKAHKREIMSELRSSVIYRNPYPQGTKEARQESMHQVMEAIYKASLKQINRVHGDSGRIPGDPRLKTIWMRVSQGKARLKDFQDAADEWVSKVILN